MPFSVPRRRAHRVGGVDVKLDGIDALVVVAERRRVGPAGETLDQVAGEKPDTVFRILDGLLIAVGGLEHGEPRHWNDRHGLDFELGQVRRVDQLVEVLGEIRLKHKHDGARADFAEMLVELLDRVGGLVEVIELGVDGKQIGLLGVVFLHHAVARDIDEDVARILLVDAPGKLALWIVLRAEHALEILERRVAKIDDVLLPVAELVDEERHHGIGIGVAVRVVGKVAPVVLVADHDGDIALVLGAGRQILEDGADLGDALAAAVCRAAHRGGEPAHIRIDAERDIGGTLKLKHRGERHVAADLHAVVAPIDAALLRDLFKLGRCVEGRLGQAGRRAAVERRPLAIGLFEQIVEVVRQAAGG